MAYQISPREDEFSRQVAVATLGLGVVDLLERERKVREKKNGRQSATRKKGYKRGDEGMARTRPSLAALSMVPDIERIHSDSMSTEATDITASPRQVDGKKSGITSSTDSTDSSDSGAEHRYKNILTSPLQLQSSYSFPTNCRSTEDHVFVDECLRAQSWIFGNLSLTERNLLVNAMSPIDYSQGESIIEQGSIGDFFYVVIEGEVVFFVDNEEVGTAGKGGCFGELALLYDSPRAATVRAESDCTLYRVDQRTFRAMMAQHAARSSNYIKGLLRHNPAFTDFDEKVLTDLCNGIRLVDFKEGDLICKKGELAETCFIVIQGKVHVTEIELSAQYANQVLSTGEHFGVFTRFGRRVANATALDRVQVVCLNREKLMTYVNKSGNLRCRLLSRRKLQLIPLLANARLEGFEHRKLHENLDEETFTRGQIIWSEEMNGRSTRDCASDGGDCPVIILFNYGGAKVFKKNGEISTMTQFDYVELLSSSDVAKIVAAANTTVHVLAMKAIIKSLGSIERLLMATPSSTRMHRDDLQLSKLRKHRILGRGTFGVVWLVSQKETSDVYSLKVQNKRACIKNHMEERVTSERNIMANTNHPFILPLICTFQDEQNLYMITKFIPGGELFSVIHRKKSHGLSESVANFYASCVGEGLSHLHDRDIVYRDLKPENIMIDENGYCVLIDLGYAKVVMGKTFTMCGTPLYIAPEVILSRGYDKSVDFWSFGVLLFEMLYGYSPFYSRGIDQIALFKRIVRSQFYFPDGSDDCEKSRCSSHGKDLIRRLLVANPDDRLGSSGPLEVYSHAWFDQFGHSASDLIAGKVKAPWIPKLKDDPLETSYFGNWAQKALDVMTDEKPLSETEQKLFQFF